MWHTSVQPYMLFMYVYTCIHIPAEYMYVNVHACTHSQCRARTLQCMRPSFPALTPCVCNYRGESLTLQKGPVTASAWRDNKVFIVMSTCHQPSESGSVLRRQRDGTRVSLPCPAAITSYNNYMGGVDQGDQLRAITVAGQKAGSSTNISFTSYLTRQSQMHTFSTHNTQNPLP